LSDAGDEKKQRKDHIRAPAYFTDQRCYEAIRMNGKDLFLLFNEDGFSTREVLAGSETQEVYPAQYSADLYTFTNTPNNFRPLNELYSRLYEVWRDYFLHPDPRVVEFLTLFDLYSYAAVKGPGCIQVFLVGSKRTGKTTAQIIMEKTAYRAFSGVNPSEAAIYRTLGWEVEYAPMVILREYERANDVMKQITREADIPGATVPRADKEDDGFTVRHYHVYGPRLCGANKLPTFTDADSDRIHIIKTVRAKPTKPRTELYLKREVKAMLRELRNDLLLWRIASYNSFEFPLEDPKGELDGRNYEHYGGIITLAGLISPELEGRMRDYIKEVLGEAAEDSKSSLENTVAQAVIELSEDKKFKTVVEGVQVPFKEVWERLRDVCTPFYEKGQYVPTKLIAPDGRVITSTTVGKLLKEQLYGKRGTWRNQEDGTVVKGYIWAKSDLELVRRLTTDNRACNQLPVVTGLEGKTTPIIDKPKDDETIRSPEANTPPEAPKTGNTGNTGNRQPTTDSATEPSPTAEEAPTELSPSPDNPTTWDELQRKNPLMSEHLLRLEAAKLGIEIPQEDAPKPKDEAQDETETNGGESD
jgi:hypothetical protein